MKSFAEVNQTVNEFVVALDKSSAYTLDRIKRLLAELGNPQEKFNTIHIAGTSGKTSTSYYVASMLSEAGYKVGLTISPHIEEINERVQIDLQPLPQDLFCAEIDKFIKIIEHLSVRPTYFEFYIIFAYWYFAKISVDYAVVEVGLGGLLDGTNVIKRADKICVITDIGLDHTHILGDSLGEISRQKAGIIQPGNHVFINQQDSSVNKVVNEVAKPKEATTHLVDDIADSTAANLPDFQRRNWRLARRACEYVFKRDNRPNLSSKQLEQTTKTLIPGRIEAINYKEKTIILDGAHNSQKTRSFISSFRNKFGVKPTAVMLAIADNKIVHLKDIAAEINKVSGFTIITTFESGQDFPKRSIDPQKIAKYFDDSSIAIEPDLTQALELLLNRKEDLYLITGSLYLVSSVRKIVRNLG